MTEEWTPELVSQKLKDNPDLSIENLTDLKLPLKNAVELGGSLIGWARAKQIDDAMMGKIPKINKYKVSNKADRTYNGMVYDSKKESLKAADLDLQIKAGEIDFWLRQIPFQLTEAVYRLDFMTFKKLGFEEIGAKPIFKPFWSIEYIEVKGRDLPMGKLKRKQVEALYKIKIAVV